MQTPSSSEQHLLIQTLEHALLHSDFRQHPQQLDALLAADFMEIGITGQITTRAAVVQWLLNKSPQARWVLEDFQVRELAPGLVLATYCAKNAAKLMQAIYQGSRCSSIWKQTAESRQTSEQWQLCFHQATAIHSGQDVSAASC
ncbi:MAG: DUF4440 domain-containing protein [Thiolinea sp.]